MDRDLILLPLLVLWFHSREHRVGDYFPSDASEGVGIWWSTSSNDSNLRLCWQGEAWAEDMYSLLATSKITINRHIDIAERYANNMTI